MSLEPLRTWRFPLLAAALVALLLSVPAAAEELVLTGSLRASEADVLVAPTTSTWQLSLKWLIREGTTVEPGDPIAVFDPAGVEDNLETSKNQLEAKQQEKLTADSEGRLQRMKLELEHKRAEVGYRKARMDADVPQEFRTEKEYREFQLELQRARTALDDAERALNHHDATQRDKLAQVDLEVAELRREIDRRETELDMLTLRATRPGLIVHEVHPWLGRKVREGDRLQATFPVARIPDLTSLEVAAWAGETDATDLAVGQPVEFTLDAFPDRRFSGRVRSVAQAADQRTSWGRASYVEVRLQLDQPDGDVMRPGMSVRCEVDLTTATGG